MNKHERVFSLLTQSTAITDLELVGPQAVQRSASTESPEDRPFVIIAWGDTFPLVKTLSDERVTIWCYDEPPSYTRLDDMLLVVRDIILGDDQLGDAVFNGFSGDLYDDMYQCVTRNVSFTLPSS